MIHNSKIEKEIVDREGVGEAGKISDLGGRKKRAADLICLISGT
jgi:hypothetical protein